MKLCFASYEEKQGMYHEIEVSYKDFDSEEIIKEAENYYKSIGVEEFLLADVWEDDNDAVNVIIRHIYSESYLEFIENMEEILSEGDFDKIDEDALKFVLNDTGLVNLIDNLGKVQIYDDILNYYYYLRDDWESNSGCTFPWDNMFYWMGETMKYDYLSEQGYNVNRLDGGRCLVFTE